MATDKLETPVGVKWFQSFTIHGEPASKANSRRPMPFTEKGKTRTVWRKSKKASKYTRDFQYQCPKLDPLLEGDLVVTIYIYYATRRPDLDESIILDAMQGLIYKNDRQIKEKHIYHSIDKAAPRAWIHIGARILWP